MVVAKAVAVAVVVVVVVVHMGDMVHRSCCCHRCGCQTVKWYSALFFVVPIQRCVTEVMVRVRAIQYHATSVADLSDRFHHEFRQAPP
jgi:hypothetical protein